MTITHDTQHTLTYAWSCFGWTIALAFTEARARRIDQWMALAKDWQRIAEMWKRVAEERIR